MISTAGGQLKMGTERQGKRAPATPKVVQRRKLSNITNLQGLRTCQESSEESLPCFPIKNNDVELQKEVTSLMGLLSEKEKTIQAQAEHIEKLTLSLEQKSAQNEEIIQHYYRQYKDLEQARQELKLLQHEYTQMAAVYRISKNEFQSKLEEANERIIQLLEEKDRVVHIKKHPSTQIKQVRKKTRRASGDLSTCSTRIIHGQEHSNPSKYCPTLETLEDDASTMTLRPDESCERKSASIAPPIKTTTTTVTPSQRPVGNSGRPVRKAVESITSYKEPPLNTKMRRPR